MKIQRILITFRIKSEEKTDFASRKLSTSRTQQASGLVVFIQTEKLKVETVCLLMHFAAKTTTEEK